MLTRIKWSSLNEIMRKSLIIVTLFGIALISSCKRDLQFGDQEVELSAPLVSTSVSLKNFIAPENYEVGSEGQVNLVYDLDLYNEKPIESLEVPDRTDFHKVSLETISLSNTAIESQVTLGEAYTPAILLHGQTFEIDTITLFRPATIPIDANTFFESADLESGWMIMTIENGFPVDIEYMLFRLRNASDNSLIGELEFFDIPAGESKKDSISMAGVFAEGSMIGELVKVKTRKSDGEVLINKNDAIKVKVEAKELKAYTATAIFPEQDLINIDLAWDYDFGGPELTDITIESGTLFMQVESSINEIVYVTYEAPGIIDPSKPKGLDTVIQKFEVPAAVDGKGITESREISMAGYEIILRGKSGEGWLEKNAFHNRLIASILYTGVKKKISKEDSITLRIELRDIKPSYAAGYLGQDTFTVGPEIKKMSVFKNLSGVLDIEDVEVSMKVDNSAGIDAKLEVPSVVSQGRDGDVALTSPLLADGISVGMATDLVTPWSGTTTFNNSNSNVDRFIENFPLSFLYNLEVYTNPEGNDNNWGDFISSSSELRAGIVLDIPMNLKPTDVVLRDTIAMGLGQLAGNLENTNGLNLNMIIDNGYPYFVDVDFILLDETGLAFDTLFHSDDLATPGIVPSNTVTVSEPFKTVLTNSLSQEQALALSDAKKAILIATLQSPSETFYPIYDSYTIDIKLTADVAYKQGFE